MNEDLNCVQRVKAGDLSAFTTLVNKYRDFVFTVVVKITGNREDAEDLTQEIFIRVYKSLHRFKATSQFATWLYRIACNTAISELRRRKMHFVAADGALNDIPTADDSLDDREIQLQHLETALQTLSPDEIFIVHLYYMDNRRVEDIGKICSLSETNVKVKLHRIRRKLYYEIAKLMKHD